MCEKQMTKVSGQTQQLQAQQPQADTTGPTSMKQVGVQVSDLKA
jgi:hypothetical protein